jgi:Contractile injection system tape measure protein
MNHLVNRLQFEMTCATESTALRVRHSLATQQPHLEALINEVCNSQPDEDGPLRIDRIEINLGTMTPDRFNEEWMMQFRRQLEDQLSRKSKSTTYIASQQAPAATAPQDAFQLVQYFLLQGYLPWWGHPKTVMETTLLQVVEQQPGLLHDFLITQLQCPVVWQRLSLQFSVAALESVIALFPAALSQRDQWIQYSSVLVKKMRADPNAVPLLTMMDAFKEEATAWVIRLAPRWMSATQADKRTYFAMALYRFAEQNLGRYTDAQKLSNILFEILRKWAPAAIPGAIADTFSADKDDASESRPADSDTPAIAMIEPQLVAEGLLLPEQDLPAIVPAERLGIRHAGLVLLTPYLKSFFTTLHLLDKKAWVSRAAQHKAVQLLHYIATGKTECMEQDALLEKLLCGLPMEEPLAAKMEQDNVALTEADGLLKAIIANWPVLRNTSIAGLRESFIEREGLLYKKEEDWLLRVERKTIDVLLDSLPWGFSMIHLPWNKYLIHTEW